MMAVLAAAFGFFLLAGTDGSEGQPPQYVTSENGPAVELCKDALSYMCGESFGDRCVSPKNFCDGCAKLCGNTPDCEGFSFHGGYRRCQLHPAGGQLRQLSTNWTSYRRSAPAAAPNNTRGVRYLFGLPPAVIGETSTDGVGKLLPRAKCGSQTVFYVPPQKAQATTRIVGGSEVPYGAFPWQAEIKVVKDGYRGHHCGGAIVSPLHIVTAAHCIVTHNKDEYVVVLGEHDLEEADEMERAFPVDKIIIHPAYSKESKRHDLALLRLRTPPGKKSVYSERARPICLPPPFEEPKDGLDCVVSGWGRMNPNDDASLATTLRAARVGVIGPKTCGSAKVYGNKKHYFPDGTLCAGYLGGGADACGGDSGGPLACKVDGQFQLVGVVSWGDSCAEANKPGIYTRVAQYTEWLNSNMQK
ncbi:serine protease 33-like [Pollicipes pollicipes]|uniref:serine protease 33-like n=1 Tax=Pollicipes pollicipes TaxID=41117 RepID=UPI001884CC28|nr:serine protease 33-like [Pollicipes pollicipes]